MAKLTLYLDNISEWLAKIFQWGIGALMLLITFEVAMRRVLSSPTRWGLEVQVMLFAVTLVSGLGYVLLKHANIFVDIFRTKFSLKTKTIVDLLSFIFLFLPLVVATLYAFWVIVVRSWSTLEYSSMSVWAPPVYPLKTAIFVMFVLLLIQGISEIIKAVITLQKGDEKWIAER